MTRKLEVLVDPKDLATGWSEIYAGSDGQPRYRSNNALVGTGSRITRVSDIPDAPRDPLPGEALDPEFQIMADGTIDAVQSRIIPHPYPQAGVFPRMYDMVVGGTTYSFTQTDTPDATHAYSFVFVSGIYTITIGFWGFVQVSYDQADAALLPAQDQTITLLTITSHRWALEDGSRISAAKGAKVIKITGTSVAVDNVAPTILAVQPSGTDVALGAPITITASENVVAGSGNFTIYDVTSGSVLQTIPAASAAYVGNSVTITPSTAQVNSNSYALRLDAGVFEDAYGNQVVAVTDNTWSWTTGAAQSGGTVWYDEVFARRSGAGVGPRVTSWTSATAWAAATAGVSNSGTVITVSGSGITASGIDFSGFKLVNSGANNIFEDCIGDLNQNGQSGSQHQWSIGGLNPTVRFCRITNPNRIGGATMVDFRNATGTISDYNNDFRDCAAPDPWRGPFDGAAVVDSHDNIFKGIHLTYQGHIDTIDARKAAPGSKWRRMLVIGDKTATSYPAGGGTGFTNAIRQAPSDFGGAGGTGLVVEECVFVGHDDPGASSYLISIGDGGTPDNRMFDVLVDLREHNAYLHPSARFDDWYVRPFDYAASLAAGYVTGIGAPVPYPNLATQPAQVPATMSAPVIVAAPGEIQWLDNSRPLNYRSLITQYDLRYSTDGTSWTTVTDVGLDAGSISVSAANNYRIQFRAQNGIGAGAWSASSNLINVAAPAGTHRIAVIYGQSEIENILNADLSGAPVKPTLLADNKVKFVYHNPRVADPRPLVSKWLVASDASLSGAMIAFANMLIGIGGPSDTWEIGWITYTGMGWSTLFNDGSTKFPWATAVAVKNALSAAPTMQYQSWLSANRALGNSYARGFENLWLATDNGTPITAPHGVKNSAGTGTAFTASHLTTEEFAKATAIPVLGQHKFDIRQDNDTWHQPTGGSANTDYTSVNIHNCRASVDTFFAGANVGPSLRGAELCSYLNGYASGTGWTDHAHPGRKSADGMNRFAGHLAYAICEAWGLAAAQPEITSVTWAVDKVTISSSAGSITNVFADRSESQLNPSTFSHYTDCMGFYINGQPAERVEFSAGNIHVYYGDGTQNFIDTDTIMFLPGGAGASLKNPEDFQNGVWKGVPCVDIGIPGDGLMNLRPMINLTTLFPNTLVNTVR